MILDEQVQLVGPSEAGYPHSLSSSVSSGAATRAPRQPRTHLSEVRPPPFPA